MIPRPGILLLFFTALVFLCSVFAFGIAILGSNKRSHDGMSTIRPDSTRGSRVLGEETQRQSAMAGGKSHKPLQLFLDLPGVESSKFIEANAAKLNPTTEIVGIVRSGKHYAFVLQFMSKPQDHIVNMLIDNKPISVTYCDRVDCVRVLTNDSEAPIQLRVGGLDIDSQMVFSLEGTRYGQSSTDLPLQDYEFNRMTWMQWKTRYPETLVYVGPEA